MSHPIDMERSIDAPKDLVWRGLGRFVALVLGLLIAGLGVLSIASPETFHELLRHLRTPTGMYAAAGLRMILGVSLLVSAKHSRFPTTLMVFGWIFVVGGFLVLLVGFEFFRSAVDSFLLLDHWVARVWGIAALGLGAFFAYSVAHQFFHTTGPDRAQ
jgi:hypothetical protein